MTYRFYIRLPRQMHRHFSSGPINLSDFATVFSWFHFDCAALRCGRAVPFHPVLPETFTDLRSFVFIIFSSLDFSFRPEYFPEVTIRCIVCKTGKILYDIEQIKLLPLLVILIVKCPFADWYYSCFN